MKNVREIKNTYIFLDVDGTILDRGANDLYEDTKESIHQAIDNGANVWVNTGRSYGEVIPQLRDFGFSGIICGMGSVIVKDGQPIYKKMLGKENVDMLHRILKPVNCIEVYEGYQHNYIMADKPIDDMNRFNDMCQHFNCTPIYGELSLQQYEDIQKLTAIEVPNGKWIDDIKGKLQTCVHADITKDLTLEITQPGHTKAFGISKLLELVNQPNAYTVAIGDSMNDVEMLQHCTMSYWMANGATSARQYAKKATGDIKENGVGRALKDCGVID